MKNLAIINLVGIGLTFVGAMAGMEEITLGVLVIASWGLSIALSIVAMKK